MEESLLPREIPAGGVGTCRFEFSDVDVDIGDRVGCGGSITQDGG